MPYVELHARSAFSFLQGASLPEALAQFSAKNNLPAMALLDRDGLYGAPRFHIAMQQLALRAHIGAELRVGLPTPAAPYYPLLAESRSGYQNLCRLITRTKLRAAKNEI